jgi:hypothetical protein|tara:strand:- start:55 stop:381 length:327 start_codon:yes stop_codon:yes gene_type:complete
METLLNYKFDKPFYSQSQLLSIFGSISESTLKKYMKDWVEEGKDLVDMGYFRIDGVRENQWEPQTFCRWLLANKIKVIHKYDYEQSQANKIESNLIDINNKRRKNVSN